MLSSRSTTVVQVLPAILVFEFTSLVAQSGFGADQSVERKRHDPSEPRRGWSGSVRPGLSQGKAVVLTEIGERQRELPSVFCSLKPR